jgi:hypothetical protein
MGIPSSLASDRPKRAQALTDWDHWDKATMRSSPEESKKSLEKSARLKLSFFDFLARADLTAMAWKYEEGEGLKCWFAEPTKMLWSSHRRDIYRQLLKPLRLGPLQVAVGK